MNRSPRSLSVQLPSSRVSHIALPLALATALCGTSLFGATACGPEQPAEDPSSGQEQSKKDDYDPTADMEVMAEVGALPEEETVAAFKDSFPAIQECFVNGAKRIEFLGGDIAFSVEVDRMGNATVFAKETTIGDRTTESCMIDALKGAPWPRPVGGNVGTAENGFGFEMTGDVRPPVPWDEGEVADVLNENAEALESCKDGGRGSYTATVYVDRDGKAIGAGISPPDKDGERRVDCLVDVLEAATYPSPGSWPAKVTFRI